MKNQRNLQQSKTALFMLTLQTQIKGSSGLIMKIESQSFWTLFDLNVKRRLRIGPNVLSLRFMMVMGETLAQTSWRTIYINTSSNRTVSLKIQEKLSERDAMIVKRCLLILLNNSFIKSENLIDQALVRFVFCLLTIMFT